MRDVIQRRLKSNEKMASAVDEVRSIGERLIDHCHNLQDIKISMRKLEINIAGQYRVLLDTAAESIHEILEQENASAQNDHSERLLKATDNIEKVVKKLEMKKPCDTGIRHTNHDTPTMTPMCPATLMNVSVSP